MGKFIFGSIFGAAVSAVVIKRKEICEAVKSKYAEVKSAYQEKAEEIKEKVEETKSEIKD
jgi:hypothetical protein